MKNIIFSALYLLAVFSISQFLFNPAHLYEEIWWLDIPVHVMGGFGVASLAASIFTYKNIRFSYKHICIIFLIVATLWELYESCAGFTDMTDMGDIIDTLADYINGFIGATTAYLIIRKKTN